MPPRFSVSAYLKAAVAALVGFLFLRNRQKDQKIAKLETQNLKCEQGAEAKDAEREVEDADRKVAVAEENFKAARSRVRDRGKHSPR